MTTTEPDISKNPLDKILTPSQSPQLQTAIVTVAASLLGVLIALGISAFILAVAGKNPVDALTTIVETAGNTDKLVEMLDRATPLIFSATAVAIGFKMNLFNIGVEGQYLFAALISAQAGSSVNLPAPIHVLFILIVAVCAGAAWASIAAALKAYKNIHEVISTIMLNFIGLAVIQWLFDSFFREEIEGNLNVKTKLLPNSGRMPTIIEGRLSTVFFLALLVIVGYYVLVYRSRFGFRLRASGENPDAARTVGISARTMVMLSMIISGGVAGLVAMKSLLSEAYAYGPNATPIQLGFAGITVALLGRNHPVGILLAAMLFGFLDSASATLQLAGVPSSIVRVMQAIIVLCVVILNEAAIRRLNVRTAEQAQAQLAPEVNA
ncbi:MAG: ABC transporter permease [Acidimicrobiales bacterium]|nr:ABC transporter permease [Acidimicrobiales bacterium]